MVAANGMVRFDAGGGSHALHFTTNRLCMLEDAAGQSTLQIATELAIGKSQPLGISRKTLRLLFWIGLGNDQLTQAQAGDLIDAVGVQRAEQMALTAFDAAFPDDDKAGAGPQPDPLPAAAG